MAADYWYWMGAVFNGGCGGDGPTFSSWLVPGHRAGKLTTVDTVAPDWQIFLPMPMPRARTVVQVAVNLLLSSGGGPVPHCRAAIYRSRGPKCGYPGDLFYDLGTAALSSAGVKFFDAPGGIDLPAGELYWFATWWQSASKVPFIAASPSVSAGAYPVLGYANPEDLVPRCGWANAALYGDADTVDWPDPLGLFAASLTTAGQITSPPQNIGLPALFVNFS